MSQPGLTIRRNGEAAAFLDRQLGIGRVAFPLPQLLTETGLSVGAAKSQLRRLRRRVVRVSPKQAYFLIVGPEHAPRGAPPVEWWLDDYFAWLGHPYYLALQSAAGIHGSNPQAIQVTQVMTDAPRRPIVVGRCKVTFFVKRRSSRTPTQPLPNAFAPLRLSTPAATVYDLLRYAEQIGGFGRAMETLRPLLAQLDTSAISEVLATENERTTAQRLGYVLEETGHPELAAVIDRWLPGKRPLIPLAAGESDSAARLSARWRVLDNTREFSP